MVSLWVTFHIQISDIILIKLYSKIILMGHLNEYRYSPGRQNVPKPHQRKHKGQPHNQYCQVIGSQNPFGMLYDVTAHFTLYFHLLGTLDTMP